MTGAELAAIRRSLVHTQGTLANKLGVSRRTVQQWESAERPVPETIARIMRLAAGEPGFLDRLGAA